MDLIDRQDAIDALCDNCDNPQAVCPHYPCNRYTAIEGLPSAQPEEVIPHRNYKYLSDYWCACGWHLGKKGDVKYCADCGRKVKEDE